jgi:outer membrane protein OmpA-like peptidoglycan-associated protein
MHEPTQIHLIRRAPLAAGLAFTVAMMGACASTPSSPPGSAEVRSKLSALQNDTNLAGRAPVEMKDAEAAVKLAEQPLPSTERPLGDYRVYMADQQVENATDAALQAVELQRQIDMLEAESTERGLVVTLGDVLFITGSSALQNGASDRLNKLVFFLNQYPDRRVLIEGHTDNVGSTDYNQGLSQRRAESVQDYLAGQGIGLQRMSASAAGLNRPITSNDSSAGRQLNRRVEIIIENPPQVGSGGSRP